MGDDPDGLPALIERTNIQAGTPREADEQKWLAVFFDVRLATLRQPANADTAEAWRQSVDRVKCMRQIAAAGDYQLHGPLRCTVYGDKFTIE